MKMIKGLPVIVSVRNRITLDKNIRTLYQIEKDDSVLMNIEEGFLRVNPYCVLSETGGEQKNITIGRFNLPTTWATLNHIKIGDYVYLTATDTGIIVCPKDFGVEEIEKVNIWGCPLKMTSQNAIHIPINYLHDYELDLYSKNSMIVQQYDTYYVFKPFYKRDLLQNEFLITIRGSNICIPLQWVISNSIIPGKDYLYLIGIDDSLVVSATKEISI